MNEPGLLFDGKLANAEVVYVEVPIRNGAIGAFIGWPDSTSSATIALELTSRKGAAGGAAANAWKDSGVTITGPAGTGAGAVLVNVENVRQKRARLKITGAAATSLEIWDGTLP